MRIAKYAALLSAALASVSICQAQCDTGTGLCCEALDCPGFTAGAELLLFNFYGTSGAGGTGGTNVDDFFPEYDITPSGRYWLGYEMADGLGIRARYFNWQADEFYNGATRTQQFETLDVEGTLEVEVRQFEFTPFVGLRYGSVELDGSDFGEANEYDFDGLGLTFGSEMRRALIGNFALVGGLRYSLLYGDNQFTTTAPTARLDNTFLDVFEVKIGTEWSKCLCNGTRFFVGLGYEQQIYGTDSYMPNFIDPEALGDVSLGGPVFSIGFDR